MSTIKVDTLQTVAGNQLTPARAWLNFNSSGTPSVHESQNVSSITDVSNGVYGVNLSPAMTSAHYAVSGMAKDYGSVSSNHTITGANGDQNTSSVLRVRTVTLNTSGAHTSGSEADYVSLVVHQ